jgi:hypothetical protein
MRFLQLEWHNHERARNAWDIERAEMKAKIAKQEGEVRSAKKLNDQLNRHIRMLEHALTNERAKAKTGGDTHASDDKKDAQAKKSGTKRASHTHTHLSLLHCVSNADSLQPRTSTTTPSSTSTPNSSTDPTSTEMASAKSQSSTSPSASRRSPIS